MLLRKEPIECLIRENNLKNIFYLNPDGIPINQDMVRYIYSLKEVSLISGRYEGIDKRVVEKYTLSTISIGDFIVSNGEIACLALIDAVSRMINVKKHTISKESFDESLLDNDVYTRPADEDVPKELIEGNVKKIQRWKRKNSLLKTLMLREDLFFKHKFDEEDLEILTEVKRRIESLVFGIE